MIATLVSGVMAHARLDRTEVEGGCGDRSCARVHRGWYVHPASYAHARGKFGRYLASTKAGFAWGGKHRDWEYQTYDPSTGSSTTFWELV